jgi:gamma-glutamyltranspeptidase/glutathione hydrolase
MHDMSTQPFRLRVPRAPAYGSRHMVVSGHSLASLAGLRVLERGGTVADAMIACSAALCVVIPQATSAGGDAFILYRDAKTRKVEGLNASGHAPRTATPDRFPGGIPERGARAFSVPGIVRGWEEMHKKHGKLPWADLFDDAIALAAVGHPLSRVLAKGLEQYRAAVAADPGCAAVYMPGGRALKAGDIVKQPALANTLRQIAKDGARAFYEGPIGRSICDYTAKHDGLMTAADFAGYAPEWVQPLSTNYRGLTVNVMPPNSYGILMLLQLNALGALGAADFHDDPTRLGYLVRAMKAAFAEGQKHIADPRVKPAPIAQLLSAETARKLQAQVKDGAPQARVGGRGGTSCIAIADADGNGCTVVQSVFHVFGAAFLDPETGVLMNNRMNGFNVDPSHASVVAPGKRPSHTLNPVLIERGDALKYLIATPGGPAQTITLVQAITNLVDRGMDLAQAVEAPRWAIDFHGKVLLDGDYPDEIAAKLAAQGYPAARSEDVTPFGSVKAVELMASGALQGVADYRREAFAVGA